MEPPTITTTGGHGLTVGDVVSWPVRIPFRLRLAAWLRRPWIWPVKFETREYIISEISNSTSFEVVSE